MYPEAYFYQLSGYRAHSHKWFTHKKYDDKPLATAIDSMKSKLFRPGGQDSPIELVLGILPSGASYLLMTNEQMLEFTLKHRQGPPRDSWKADDFLSLSPIYFNSFNELAAKIATYKQRPRNKNRREQEEALDNSQANRGYVRTGTTVVHDRAYFEQQRTLYRLFTRDLEPGKVGLASPPWLSCVRVVSLVIGEWAADERPRDKRLSSPKLLDVGWTDALLPTFFEKLTGSTVHLKLKKTSNELLRNSGSKDSYYSEVVEDDLPGLYTRLRDLFSHDAIKSGIPLIVLVHGEDMARHILARAGIDVASWPSGLSRLVPLVPAKNRRQLEQEMLEPTVPREPSIVDMERLVKAVMKINPGYTVPQSAKKLNMQTDTKTCAGDDSLLLLRMWTLMAQGLAIDEQREEWSSRRPDCEQLLAPPEQRRADVEVDPNDFDPNDIDVVRGPRPTIADDFSDDDW